MSLRKCVTLATPVGSLVVYAWPFAGSAPEQLAADLANLQKGHSYELEGVGSAGGAYYTKLQGVPGTHRSTMFAKQSHWLRLNSPCGKILQDLQAKGYEVNLGMGMATKGKDLILVSDDGRQKHYIVQDRKPDPVRAYFALQRQGPTILEACGPDGPSKEMLETYNQDPGNSIICRYSLDQADLHFQFEGKKT